MLQNYLRENSGNSLSELKSYLMRLISGFIVSNSLAYFNNISGNTFFMLKWSSPLILLLLPNVVPNLIAFMKVLWSIICFILSFLFCKCKILYKNYSKKNKFSSDMDHEDNEDEVTDYQEDGVHGYFSSMFFFLGLVPRCNRYRY